MWQYNVNISFSQNAESAKHSFPFKRNDDIAQLSQEQLCGR